MNKWGIFLVPERWWTKKLGISPATNVKILDAYNP